MRPKEKRLRIRESTAGEWEGILEQAERERLEYCLEATIEQIDDEQTEERVAVELEDGMELKRPSAVTPKRKRKTPRWMKTCGSFKKEWLSIVTDLEIYNIQSLFQMYKLRI